MQYALVKNEVVKNIILWDGVSDYTPPNGAEAVEDDGSAVIGGGYTVEGGFTPPAEPA